MTFLDIINKVLTKLREDEVAAPTSTDYSSLIGQLVNEAKREVEDAWKWSFLRSDVTITTAQGTSQYALTGATRRYKFVNDRAFNTTQLYDLKRRPASYVKRQAAYNPSQGYPLYFYAEGLDSSGDPYVNLQPTPDGVYSIDFELAIPQADLSTGSTELTVPEWPVILGAYAKAIAERGEDQGNTSGEAFAAYQAALADEIAKDEARVEDDSSWFTD